MAATDQHSADQHSTDQHSADQHSTAVAVHSADAEEPSAEWGWHGGFPRATNIAGWITAIALFAMIYKNHTTSVEDAWLIGLGTLIVVMLIGGSISRRRSRRR